MRASTAARTKKLMKPSLTPCLAWNFSLYCLRRSITAPMSTSLKVVRMAAVDWAWSEALGDAAAQRRHLHALLAVGARARAGGSGGRSRSALGGSLGRAVELTEHVLLGDAAAGAGALELAHVHLVLLGDLPGGGRDARIGRGGRRGDGGGSSGGSGSGRRSRGSGPGLDGAQHVAHAHLVALLEGDGEQGTAGGRGHVDGDLVGLEDDERLVRGDGVTLLLVPLSDDGFSDGLAQGRDFQFNGHSWFLGGWLPRR